MKLMIVDDHPGTREVIRETVAGLVREICECVGGEEAVRRYPEFLPDYVTMDVRMEPMNGMEAMRRILGFHPGARVIVVSQFDVPAVRIGALRLGAVHFVDKNHLEELRRYLVAQLGLAGGAEGPSTPP